MSLSICVSPPLSLSIFRSVCLSFSLSLSLPLYLSPSFSISPPPYRPPLPLSLTPSLFLPLPFSLPVPFSPRSFSISPSSLSTLSPSPLLSSTLPPRQATFYRDHVPHSVYPWPSRRYLHLKTSPSIVTAQAARHSDPGQPRLRPPYTQTPQVALGTNKPEG